MKINKALITQIKLLCQKIVKAEPLCDLIASLSEKSTNARIELEQADETINNFLEWQDTDEGQTTGVPRILESHKEILFTEW